MFSVRRGLRRFGVVVVAFGLDPRKMLRGIIFVPFFVRDLVVFCLSMLGLTGRVQLPLCLFYQIDFLIAASREGITFTKTYGRHVMCLHVPLLAMWMLGLELTDSLPICCASAL